jgi:hypothetical protein
MIMVVALAIALFGLMSWVAWLWRRTPAPVWTGLVALVPIGLGVWCTIAMAVAFMAASRVPVTLAAHEQARLVMMHNEHAYRWGMRFWGAGLVSALWLLFVMYRWECLDPPPRGERGA